MKDLKIRWILLIVQVYLVTGTDNYTVTDSLSLRYNKVRIITSERAGELEKRVAQLKDRLIEKSGIEVSNAEWEVPAAREYMLKKCEEFAKSSPTYDLLKFHGGDGGGCECDRCDPYGLTSIRLVEDMANIIHQYHPETRIYFTNQKFDNADDQARKTIRKRVAYFKV